jgi:UDP-N-acetylmuramate dehydrogenase
MDVTIEENVSLAGYTTLGVGGAARWFAHATSESELLQATLFANTHGLPIFVLGGGSNLLASDSGFPGLVIQAAIGGRVRRDLRGRSTTVIFDVPAGTVWDEFVEITCQGRLTGVECLAGIPGLVGGTPVQNVGAYGQEVSQTIASVRVLDLQSLEFRNLSAAECQFGYRSSIFNTVSRGKFIVTRVSFEFDLDAAPNLTYADLLKHFAGQPSPTPLEICEAVREIRRRKGMLLVEGDPDAWSAGSFFKNPVVAEGLVEGIAAAAGVALEGVPRWPAGEGKVKLAAAWLVEQAGFAKGFKMGRAGISTKHTLALVNLGGATAVEVMALRDAVVEGVEGKFGVRLEQEPVELGKA